MCLERPFVELGYPRPHQTLLRVNRPREGFLQLSRANPDFSPVRLKPTQN